MDTEKGSEISIAKTKAEIKRKNVLITVVSSVIIFSLLAAGFWFVSSSSSFSSSHSSQSGGHEEVKTPEIVQTNNNTTTTTTTTTVSSPDSTETSVIDSRRIYFAAVGPEKHMMSIYSVDQVGMDRKRIYDTYSELSELNVSPDGDFLIFMSNFNVCMIKHDGTGFKNFGNGLIVTKRYPFSQNGKYVIFLKLDEKRRIVKLAEIKGEYYEIKKEFNLTTEMFLEGFSADDEGFIYYDAATKKYFNRNIENDQDMECDYPYRHVSPDGKKKLTISSDPKDETMRFVSISNLDGSQAFKLSKYKWGNISYLDISPRWHRNGMKILIFEKNEEDSQYSNARILELDADRTKVIKESEIVVKGPFNEITW
jgi:hypothetical protein